ncbi:MAG: RnfABCDGE type electron transport complex subunit C, partial [Planctomycetes bacterium]|nr:RnfABCDGE type electron transport complex subunit C [Planctomycetota bacterium]
MVVGSSKLTFPRGGIHPGGSKDRTKDKELIASEPPAVVEVPMVQHIGAPAKPVVDRKDEVKKGQLIGEAQGFISANVHAPLSGKVKKIANRIHNPTGKPVPAVIIENDGEEEWAEGCNEKQSPEQMSPEELVDQVQQSGIVGMGGATFPSHVKLSPPEDKPIEDVILNGAECEPALTCDYRLMLEKTREILDAVRLIMRTVDAPRGHIGIESNKPDAIEAFNDAVAGEPNIEVCPLEVKYPQGAEQQLIVAVTGREVPNGGGLPADVG